jgi:hypothetical protein
MSNFNTQLSNVINYDVNNMIFSKPVMGSIPNSKPEIKFYRINISTKNPNGTVGELILPTSELFSFGVSENTDPITKVPNGYVFSICLANKDGASDEEQAWIDTFNFIVEKCKDHVLEHKGDVERYDLERNDLKKLNCLYYKKEKGVIVPGAGPTLYAKLIASKKHNKILSMFFDQDNNELNPLDLVGKYCFARSSIKIESIFINASKISLQVKLYEAEVRLLEMGMKRLLSSRRPDPVKKVEVEEKPDEESSEESSEEDIPPPRLMAPEKKIIKKIVKK